MKKILISCFCLPLFLVSCNQEGAGLEAAAAADAISTYEDYFNFVSNTDTKGNLIIQTTESMGTQGTITSVTSNVTGDKKPLPFKVGGNEIQFNDYYYSADVDKSYANIGDFDAASLYGVNYEIKVGKDNVTAVEDKDTNKANALYMPKRMQSVPTALASGYIVPGSKLSWNADASNAKGVVVGFEYDPHKQSNQAIATNYPDRLIYGKSVVDNGSYTVALTDLKSFPTGAVVTFYVGRAGYKIVTDDTGSFDYSMATITMSRGDYNIKY